jgi:hypothetical protein
MLIKVMYFAANILLHGKFQMIGSHCNCSTLFLSKCGFANCYAFNNVLFGYEIQKKTFEPQNIGWCIGHSSIQASPWHKPNYLLHNMLIFFSGSSTSMMVLLLHYNCINMKFPLVWNHKAQISDCVNGMLCFCY